jgi:menaquinone-dependent protoporphyrinogen oxidase
MDIKVLVAYATKKGATAEIAEEIGRVFQQAGLLTDVLPTDRVTDLSPYKAVVLGSAVYIGQWQKKAAAFLQANEEKLAELPVWLFSSGPTGKGDPAQLMNGWRFPKALCQLLQNAFPDCDESGDAEQGQELAASTLAPILSCPSCGQAMRLQQTIQPTGRCPP